MDITIIPTKLSGSIEAIPSKSQAHRLLICAAFSDAPVTLICKQINHDIEATADCLTALGADIVRTKDGFRVTPISLLTDSAILNCRESGSTLRFMLPIVGALGVDATFHMEGRLPQRPLSPLWEEMERMGCRLTRPTENTLRCTGKLLAGDFSIDGSVSSQYITGLLFATSLLGEGCSLTVTGKAESAPYIDMTREAIALFGGKAPFRSPGTIDVEGDWSNGAFYIAAGFLGNDVNVTGLRSESLQGDRACVNILDAMQDFISVDVADIPDLVPILAVAAGCKKGATFVNAGRLRLKESDRIESVAAMLRALGADVETTADSLTVYPARYKGCVIDSAGDHRIAMAAAIAATCAEGHVTIQNAQCVAKSYPTFWDVYRTLGGKICQVHTENV